MKKGFLICFTGLDGTGKTTLSKRLTKFLGTQGIKCSYVYARLKPFISRPFIVIGEIVFLRKKNIFENYIEYSNIKKNAIKKYSFLSAIYQQILILDYILQIFLKINIPLILGRNIVCDRYIYDTVITDISVDMNYSKGKVIKTLYKLFYLCPKPDIIFLVDIPENIAFARKNDIPSIMYLKDRRDAYLIVGKEFNVSILDGTKSLNMLDSMIQKIVTERVAHLLIYE